MVMVEPDPPDWNNEMRTYMNNYMQSWFSAVNLPQNRNVFPSPWMKYLTLLLHLVIFIIVIHHSRYLGLKETIDNNILFFFSKIVDCYILSTYTYKKRDKVVNGVTVICTPPYLLLYFGSLSHSVSLSLSVSLFTLFLLRSFSLLLSKSYSFSPFSSPSPLLAPLTYGPSWDFDRAYGCDDHYGDWCPRTDGNMPHFGTQAPWPSIWKDAQVFLS